MPSDYVQVYAVKGSFVAESIVALLKSFNIDAYFNLACSEITDTVGIARIFVPQKNYADANQILNQMENGKLQSSPWDHLPRVDEDESEDG